MINKLIEILGIERIDDTPLDAEARAQACAEIVKRHRVEGILDWSIETTTEERQVRAWRDRPARTQYLPKLRSLGVQPANSYKHHAPAELRAERLIS